MEALVYTFLLIGTLMVLFFSYSLEKVQELYVHKPKKGELNER